MNPPSDSPLKLRNAADERLHLELQRLPDQEAPVDFVEGVMRGVHRQVSRPWWKQPLTLWPQGPRLTGLMVLALSAMAATWVLLNMDVRPDWARLEFSEFRWQESLQTVWQQVANLPLATYLQLINDTLWRELSPTWIWISCIGLGLVCCIFTGLGTFLARLLTQQNRAC